MWWDANTIESTVTRQFVCSHLLADEIARLDRPLGFGDGLTDGTYWEWIDEKAKKIFLILVDLGVPDQIFGIIDDSWDDEDLPVELEQVERLALTPGKDERFERKFYQRQFYYLLTPLEQGEHTFYQDMEVVPLDVVDRRPSGSSGSSSISSSSASGASGAGGSGSGGGGRDRVALYNYPGQVFARRRIPLAPSPESSFGSGFLSYDDFQYEANCIRGLQNDHLVSYWGSYVHQGYGYVLFTPISDGNIKSLLATTPASIKSLAKKDRRQLMLNWIHCLVDTLCFLHLRGLSHGNIKPSTVLFNNANHVFFSDFTHFGAEMNAASGSTDKASFDKESYDYAAPEQWYRPSGGSHGSGAGGSGSSSGSSRKSTLTGETIYGRGGAARGMTMGNGIGGSLSSSDGGAGDYAYRGGSAAAANPQLNPQAADIFSLGCIILELLGFMLKRTTRSFATHRAAKHKTPGRGGAVLDSSFHKNLGQVESWMVALAREAAGKKKDDPALAGVAPMLHVVERMLAPHPSDRLTAFDVQTRMYQILREDCSIAEPHCVHQYGAGDAWDAYGLGRMGLGSLRIANTNYSYPHTSSSVEAAAGGSGAISPRSAGGYYMDGDGGGFASKPASRHSSMSSSSHHGRHHLGRRPSRANSQSSHSIGSGSAGSIRAGSSGGGGGSGVGIDLASGLQAIRNLQIRDKLERRP